MQSARRVGRRCAAPRVGQCVKHDVRVIHLECFGDCTQRKQHRPAFCTLPCVDAALGGVCAHVVVVHLADREGGCGWLRGKDPSDLGCQVTHERRVAPANLPRDHGAARPKPLRMRVEEVARRKRASATLDERCRKGKQRVDRVRVSGRICICKMATQRRRLVCGVSIVPNATAPSLVARDGHLIVIPVLCIRARIELWQVIRG
mmetsp:Transcript_22724/g.45591  ORF Transcript_22724/g.45591 Transcript_22724/m.45591 type:complete len:204 (-) Transcript_22724:16-627(-)